MARHQPPPVAYLGLDYRQDISRGLAAVVTAVGIHFLFGHWLDIPLPTGWVGW